MLNIPFFFYFNFVVHQQTLLFYIVPIDLFSIWQQAQLPDSKTMLHAVRENFENFGHTTKNKIFRLVKLLADLCTGPKRENWNTHNENIYKPMPVKRFRILQLLQMQLAVWYLIK